MRARLQDAIEKLNILGAASSFDVCAASCWPSRRGQPARATTSIPGVYRAAIPGGGCISLFKVLMTDECLNDCAYCINQVDLKRHRSAFQPEELAATFMEFHRLGYAAGLFLTSAISGGAPHSMEPMLKAVDIVRHNYGFDGYIHLKVLPGAPFQYVEQACRLADRVSLNVEAPSPKHLARLSSGKDLEKDILAPMRWIKGLLGRPGISASGQTTQFIVGAGTETDLETFESTARLYEEMGLSRVYFSAFRPIRGTLLQDQPPAPPMREHRLYQVDWLLRVYGYAAAELKLAFSQQGNLSLEADPKQTVAWQEPWRYPIDINRADYADLIRVPGIGPISARRIVQARRDHTIDSLTDLRKMGVVTRRAAPLIHFPGHKPEGVQAPLPLALV